jgi:hypothetical protein
MMLMRASFAEEKDRNIYIQQRTLMSLWKKVCMEGQLLVLPLLLEWLPYIQMAALLNSGDHCIFE